MNPPEAAWHIPRRGPVCESVLVMAKDVGKNTAEEDVPAGTAEESRFYEELPYACLAANGWIKAYEEPYQHATTSADIVIPPDATAILMGGMEDGDQTIRLAAVGPPDVLE